jgi:RimJ/RimL family protein N-acetyltransferase
MLRGQVIGLRARLDSDIDVFEAEMLDWQTRLLVDGGPWRPVAPGSSDSPYREAAGRDESVRFSVIELATSELAGDALLWGIDPHNRSAHLGLGLRPAFRGRHLGTDLVRVLVRYGFALRSLYRLQIDTLADNHAMIGAALRAGFVQEGILRQSAWVDGAFSDIVVFGLLLPEWSAASAPK